jgi:XTP/dITP diphosphohydrolase
MLPIKIVIATNNKGKLREFQHILSDWQLITQSAFDVPPVAETGLSFVENAIIKARHAAQHTGLAAIADDSGLEVDALDGEPGIYSARFAGEQATDADNNNLLLEKLSHCQHDAARTARFQCAIAFMRYAHDANPLIAQASWAGIILPAAQGENGFGYDPLFYVPSHNCSSAQLSPEIKNQISHRAMALQELQRKLKIM